MILPISNNMQELEKGNMSMKQFVDFGLWGIYSFDWWHPHVSLQPESGTFDPFQWNTCT